MKFQWSIAACLLALLVFASSASATGEFEPNDNRDTAAGPLEGGKPYAATFETDNDLDWYYFYVKTYSQMDFSATLVKSERNYSHYYQLLNKDGEFVDSFNSGYLNETRHLLLTLSPGRYYLKVDGYTKDTYRFQIDPAAAITPSRDCGEAIVAKESVGPQLAKVAGELSKNDENLAKPTELVQADEAVLAGLNKRWEQFLVKWKQAKRRLAKRHGIRGYVRRRKVRSLVASKRRTSQRLRSGKVSARQKLQSARSAQAKVLEQRSGLEAVQNQANATRTQAEAQIAANC